MFEKMKQICKLYINVYLSAFRILQCSFAKRFSERMFYNFQSSESILGVSSEQFDALKNTWTQHSKTCATNFMTSPELSSIMKLSFFISESHERRVRWTNAQETMSSERTSAVTKRVRTTGALFRNAIFLALSNTAYWLTVLDLATEWQLDLSIRLFYFIILSVKFDVTVFTSNYNLYWWLVFISFI